MVYGKMFYFIILTLVLFFITLIGRCYALLCPWQMFLPVRCYLPYEMWQMLLPLRKMLSSYFVSGRCYCTMMLWKMLYHFTVCCNTLYWLMLLPGGRWNSQATYYCHLLLLSWQMLLPSGRWNGHCRVVVDYQLVDVITRWQMDIHGWSYFNFRSEVLSRTSSHMWGRWYLPMFLFRDGIFTLMNNASFIYLPQWQ